MAELDAGLLPILEQMERNPHDLRIFGGKWCMGRRPEMRMKCESLRRHRMTLLPVGASTRMNV
jgi:hypothetical protein